MFKNRLLIGLTLFSMFFGAGNLIFPPYLGSLAGASMPWAMAGFVITAVCFPIFAVITVARFGGLQNLAGRVHPVFAVLFTVLIYLVIGPFLGIPRTASTSFEMAIAPFLSMATASELTIGEHATAQAIYLVFFFALAAGLALTPERLTEKLGKYASPALITLIVGLFVTCLIHPLADYGITFPPYDYHAFLRGFLEGYQTMDTLAALNFGLIIAINLRALGVHSTTEVVRETVRAGFIAGALLIVIYCALAHIGATVGGAGLFTANGAQTLTTATEVQYGSSGSLVLGAIYFVACLGTCVGLLSCCANYFTQIMPALSYRSWLLFCALCSFIVSNAGLDLLLKASIPVLMAIYPPALMLVILGLTHHFNRNFSRIYPMTITLTSIVSIGSALQNCGFTVPLLSSLPFYSVGLEWIAPALIGWVIGLLYSKSDLEL